MPEEFSAGAWNLAVGAKIKMRREGARLALEDVAETLNCSVSKVRNLETGKTVKLYPYEVAWLVALLGKDIFNPSIEALREGQKLHNARMDTWHQQQREDRIRLVQVRLNNARDTLAITRNYATQRPGIGNLAQVARAEQEYESARREAIELGILQESE